MQIGKENHIQTYTKEHSNSSTFSVLPPSPCLYFGFKIHYTLVTRLGFDCAFVQTPVRIIVHV